MCYTVRRRCVARLPCSELFPSLHITPCPGCTNLQTWILSYSNIGQKFVPENFTTSSYPIIDIFTCGIDRALLELYYVQRITQKMIYIMVKKPQKTQNEGGKGTIPHTLAGQAPHTSRLRDCYPPL